MDMDVCVIGALNHLFIRGYYYTKLNFSKNKVALGKPRIL